MSEKTNKTNRIIADIMGGDIFSKDSFVNLFPFLLYPLGLPGRNSSYGI